MQELIYDALKVLMEESYLYRSQRIDISPILALADIKCSAETLDREFQQRPWIPWSQNRGFTSGEGASFQQRMELKLGYPLHMPSEQMSLPFFIPTVKTWCFECKKIAIHDSIPHIDTSPNPEAIAEPSGIQNFLFDMMCQECKSPPTTFMVRREQLKVQLCGRSHVFLPQAPDEIPKAVRNIFKDAVGAAACGDVFGAFYHLRTLMEHHMKTEVGIDIGVKMDGDALCARYNQEIDPVLRDRCSLKAAFDNCSSNLHNRTGTLADYETVVDTILSHFKLKQTLQKLESGSR